MNHFTHGMNLEEVRRLGTTMQQRGEEIAGIMNNLQTLLTQADWVGPDQRDFLSNAWPSCQARMKAVVETLQEGGQTALRNAQEQQQASGT